MKIAIIGTGNVGSSIAFALVLKGLGNHRRQIFQDVNKPVLKFTN